MVFNRDWFSKHQKMLLLFANSYIGKRILCIDGKKSSVGNNKIVKIEPNAITWVVDRNEKEVKLSTEFRTDDKFAKRLYYTFKPIWYLAHYFDLGIANNLDERLNLGFDTLTAYPDADPETSTVDGRTVRNNGSTETFSTLRAGAGTSGEPSAATNFIPALQASTTSNQYSILIRGIRLFDTSSLTAVATINSAVFSEYVQDNTSFNQLSGGASPNSAMVLVSSNPASNTNIVASDHGSYGSIDFGRSVAQSSLSATAYNDINLNASGIAAISKTGITKFGTMFGWDFDNTTTGITWASNGLQGSTVSNAETTGTSQDPKLVVTYSLGSGNFLMFM